MTPDGTPLAELPPPEPERPRGRWSVDGADWTRWPLVRIECVLERLRELGVLA